jgi:hypothetical protein
MALATKAAQSALLKSFAVLRLEHAKFVGAYP